MPGTDWIRLGTDGIRRPDLRAQLITDDGEPILFRYDVGRDPVEAALFRGARSGEATDSTASTCGSRRSSRSAPDATRLAESLFLGRGRLTGPRAIAYELYRVL